MVTVRMLGDVHAEDSANPSLLPMQARHVVPRSLPKLRAGLGPMACGSFRSFLAETWCFAAGGVSLREQRSLVNFCQVYMGPRDIKFV